MKYRGLSVQTRLLQNAWSVSRSKLSREAYKAFDFHLLSSTDSILPFPFPADPSGPERILDYGEKTRIAKSNRRRAVSVCGRVETDAG